jgi:hypothetical protein
MKSDQEQYEMSCWSTFISYIYLIHATIKSCFTPNIVEKNILFEDEQSIYLISKYQYNKKLYNIPIKIEKDTTVSFIKATSIIFEEGIKTIKEEIDITSSIIEWLGPNEDFHHSIITPKLLGINYIRIQFMDSDTLDIVERIFKENEPLSLSANTQLEEIIIDEKINKPSLSIHIDEVELAEIVIENDPREPRPIDENAINTIDEISIKERHIR